MKITHLPLEERPRERLLLYGAKALSDAELEFVTTQLEAAPAGTPPPAESLGASLYQDAQNPIKDNLDTTNPFDGAYRNPFE